MQTLPLVNIIGAGRVGQTLAHLLYNKKLATIQNVYCRTQAHAEAACHFIGSGQAIHDLDQTRSANIYLLTVPDAYIKTTCEKLTLSQSIRFKNSTIIHCSGALSAEETLMSAQLRGAHIASVHPILSFSSPEQAILNYPGTLCGIEGSPVATEKLTQLFSALGASPFEISSTNKSLYHAACVLSNNYTYVLSHLASQLLEHAGLATDFAKQISLTMIESALNNLQTLSPQQALTGPIARAEHSTINNHQQAIAEIKNTEVAALYQKLGEYCVNHLTSHTLDIKAELIKQLTPKKIK
ncbi:hypothetical protein PsalMR5_03034 [Piscirickettsia salmonis]|uniref:Rossmann-like and DUF2520 domain-containing protein n=1 Tax=Piscirickettsia salmonis TaxID=1238 RepID=UPI0012BA9E86|nr:Rossmann-like and DUF2520 domain-containing protein [Piscirickettsia salmonis]QGP55577.1 hypothetical protein PsalSR1_03030 [Piscirickettsia salmonis]QGP58570.1 hypothetical protein PsalBI1_01142 [Piscirickettsia salmonis]QGP65146.1 hypothetical protein PsalMR5_03034 [Piscirickettsia salmonis]